jgi:hypothetical protein
VQKTERKRGKATVSLTVAFSMEPLTDRGRISPAAAQIFCSSAAIPLQGFVDSRPRSRLEVGNRSGPDGDGALV